MVTYPQNIIYIYQCFGSPLQTRYPVPHGRINAKSWRSGSEFGSGPLIYSSCKPPYSLLAFLSWVSQGHLNFLSHPSIPVLIMTETAWYKGPIHCKKRLRVFLSWRVWLVTSRLGTWKLQTFFYSVHAFINRIKKVAKHCSNIVFNSS